KRKVITEIYEAGLDGLVKFQEQNQQSSRNYSYFPVIFRTEEELLRVHKALIQNDIISRRYLYQSLDSLSYIEPKQYMPISR
ncbi:DegT/DnrJ/EryC1/StrS family aminotransferase, partial [Francisella tularensis subsp. holarctica]|nr:DegT/DnrJ/EryC1/StrS family aminotransferase [Francisella tularensis subsp. holarctica]